MKHPILVLLLLGFAGIVQADIYRHVDANGVAHFTNRPIPGDKRYQRVLRTAQPPAVYAAPVSYSRSATPFAIAADGYTAEIGRLAEEFALDAALVRAVVIVESASNPAAVSPKGAMGLMQLMPATARRYGVQNPFDPEQNLRGGIRYLRDLLAMFSNDIELALAAYNAGEQNVIRHGRRVPPFAETLNYVPKVLAVYRRLRGESA